MRTRPFAESFPDERTAMEIKASLLEWLLEIQVPEEDLPLTSYEPKSAKGTILVSEEAEAALLNGKGTWAVVTHVLKSRGKTLPHSDTTSNPLKRGRTAIDRLHNWSFIERLLSTVGIIVNPDLKALAVAGDCDAVATILGEIRDFCLNRKQKKAERDAEEAAAEDQDDAADEDEGEIIESAVAPRAISAPASSYAYEDDGDEDRVQTSVSKEARDLYSMPRPTNPNHLEDSDSCAQFFVRSLSKHFRTDHSETLKFLIEDDGIIEDWVVRGKPAGKFETILNWLNEIIAKVTDLCFHVASEPSTLSVSLSLISSGIKSRNREVALTTCFLLKQAIGVLDKYYLWKASRKWFTSKVGALGPLMDLTKRFADAEVSQAVCNTLRAFYREDFPQIFLPDVQEACRDFGLRANFLREMMYAIAKDETVENGITNDSVSLLFQYFMEQLERADSDFAKHALIDAITVCWEGFDIRPNVEIRIKTIMGHIQAQCRSPHVEIRHGAVFHLFSLFDHLLKYGEGLMLSCQQAVMSCYVENYRDVFMHHAILKNLVGLLETHDNVPLSLPVTRLASKVIEEGKMSSLQLQVLQAISTHPNLGIGDALSVFKLMLSLTNSQGLHTNTCMTIVLNMLDRMTEEEEAIAALTRYRESLGNLRLRKKSKKADFVSMIDLFLEQREDFAFVQRNLDEQFLATVGAEDHPMNNNKENYGSPAGAGPRRDSGGERKIRGDGASPRRQVGFKDRDGAQGRGGDSKYNARRRDHATDLPKGSPVADRQARRKPAAKVARGASVEAKQRNVSKGDKSKNGQPPQKAPPAKKKVITKEEALRIKERHRREIEDIKSKRAKKEAALRKQEQERLAREEHLRVRHIQKRNQIVRNRSAAPRQQKQSPSKDHDPMIQELVMEALKRRLESDPDTPMPAGYTKHLEHNYYSGLVDAFKAEGGETSGEAAHVCIGILADLLEEKLQIPAKTNLLGTVVVKRAEVAPSQGKESGNPGPRAEAKAPSARKKPKKSSAPPPSAAKVKSARYYRRSPIYHVREWIDLMVHQAVKTVHKRAKPTWQKAKPLRIHADRVLGAESSEDRLKFSHMKKEQERREREESERAKKMAEKEEREKRKQRADFLKKKLERQKMEREERDRKMIEEAKLRQEEEAKRKALVEQKERARRQAQKEKIQQYKEQKAREGKAQKQNNVVK